ncbi:MAG TPA: hypothetical protein V6C96_04945 [Vampirovibrionales bacterium]
MSFASTNILKPFSQSASILLLKLKQYFSKTSASKQSNTCGEFDNAILNGYTKGFSDFLPSKTHSWFTSV